MLNTSLHRFNSYSSASNRSWYGCFLLPYPRTSLSVKTKAQAGSSQTPANTSSVPGSITLQLPTIGSVTINQPDTKDPNKWLIVKDESSKPDKKKFMLDQLKADEPNISNSLEQAETDKDKRYELLMKLVSRSKALAEWLKRANDKYSLSAVMPTYYDKIVKPEDYDASRRKIEKISELAARKQLELNQAAVEYRNKCLLIENRYNGLINPLKDDNITKVLTLSSDQLPISIQLAIESYNPGTPSTLPTKDVYAREMIAQYKILLLQQLTTQPDLDIDSIIKSSLKL